MATSQQTTSSQSQNDEHEVAHIEIESTSTNASRQTTLIVHDDPTTQYHTQHHQNTDSAVPPVPTISSVTSVPSVRIASPAPDSIPIAATPPVRDAATAPAPTSTPSADTATAGAASLVTDKETTMPSTMNTFQATVTPPQPMHSSNHGALAQDDPNIQQLSQSLKEANLRNNNRMVFEPIASLPTSRVPSHESIPKSPSQRTLDSYAPGPRSSMASINSPPLTPSGTDMDSGSLKMMKRQAAGSRDSIITPQPSSSQDTSPRTHQSEFTGTAKTSVENFALGSTAVEDHARQNHHRRGMFSLGKGASASSSRESSPSRAASYYSRPFTPGGDSNNPYAASKRAPQPSATSNPKNVEPRFQFSRKKKLGSPCTSSTSLLSPEKRHHHHKDDHGSGDKASTPKGSMVDLKRFFKKAHHNKRDKSPAVKPKAQSPKITHSMPFGEDHGLVTKYGKFGKVLGSGAGGSVRVMKRSDDNTVFAVKEFRARHTYESEKEYAKKLTGEFCIGSTLRHGNVIETLDILQERGRWFVVMEYAPFDLFAIVMTGKMTRPEVSCCFLQILNGVTYLHSMGLAHRDLKLDNVVVSANGIMKIIDFGSAHVFSYPFEEGIIKAKGIVGSDPYLAPEVYDDKLYDPRAVDIWSLGIIYCCMTLRRFPWKVPRLSDNSYKLYASEPTPGHDPHKMMAPMSPTVGTPGGLDSGDYFSSHHGKNHHHRNHHGESSVPGTPRSNPASPGPREARHGGPKSPTVADLTGQNSSTPGAQPTEKKEVIKGPWRILRLLPNESRKVIYGMLTIDPSKRMTMDQIIADDWVANTVICQQLPKAEVIKATDHTHTLEPPLPPSQPQQKPGQTK
ncbi:hypothetical protein BROUX41_001512 [Berkeleyomyces rouxiae]|uniref:uncharacterized protein n=1 Tax=Berkeleyomyces rouxiae TaxID=2035830 RepID=UPI003B79C18C